MSKTLKVAVLFSLFSMAHAADVRHIDIDAGATGKPRDRFADMIVGSDYPGVLMRDDSLAQLKIAKDELGFRYLRFHGIFHDVMGVYKEVDGKPVYDWSKIDALYDRLLAIGLKPFVELSFTPHAMRGSNAVVFSWKGNISHPDPVKWGGLVEAFVRHLQERYGQEEVRTWFFEVWNEPNLRNFWEKADRQAYFRLYDVSAKAIKSVDPQLRVGGPSTAGAAWVPELLAHTRQSGAAVDFISTHTYGAGGGFLDPEGTIDTRLLTTPDAVVGDVHKVRREMNEAGHAGMPLYFTEWNASWGPRDPVHDSYVNAPYILSKLKGVEGAVQAMAYWTYSDLFEELAVQTRPFDGGFGLMNPQGVRKPAWFAYKYLKQLGETALPASDAQSLVAKDARGVQVLAWDFELPPQVAGNRAIYGKVLPARDTRPLRIEVKGLKPGNYAVQVHRTGYEANDAYTTYLKMGSPEALTPRQLDQLQEATQDRPHQATMHVPASGTGRVDVTMRTNDVVLVKISPK